MTWDEVAAIALALPGAERSTRYGREAIKVGGKMFVVTGKDDDHFVLTATLDEVEMLMATEPDCFFQTPHYVGWPSVLVRYATADPERIAVLVARAWARRASKAQLAARG
ncbi:MmcQ/YjbR family DNA-binding protein [Sandarakinorhabdus sp. DWP1-3-1]|uniref:MmcQ/YjbR family DNA-binding protein n=1 Tax=Sandarakinorhabdus sp. DWP1-3-1 TaxID=2804627 RepID=UPI003CF248B4